MALQLRPETPDDHDAIRRVHAAAFGAGAKEPELVDALRTSHDHVPELSLLAQDGDAVVGHVMYSRATLDTGHAILALGPLAVVPERRRDAIGTMLVRESLTLAATTDSPLVVVLGHPELFSRLGFEPARPQGVLAPWPVPTEAWLMHRLPSYRPSVRGLVLYPDAFEDVAPG